jgi:hypothetical protein
VSRIWLTGASSWMYCDPIASASLNASCWFPPMQRCTSDSVQYLSYPPPAMVEIALR